MPDDERDACFAILETAKLAEVESPLKQWATLQARAALVGATLHSLGRDGGTPLYVVSWRALTRSFDSVLEVDAWLTRFEGGNR